MRTRGVSVVVLLLGFVFCTVSLADAPCDGWTWWDGGLPGYARLPLRTGNVPAPPYFALHPPVYYQGITPRPYGRTPFADAPANCRCQSGHSTAQKHAQLVVNPYLNASTDERMGIVTTPRPAWIINPYYEPAVATAAIPGGR